MICHKVAILAARALFHQARDPKQLSCREMMWCTTSFEEASKRRHSKVGPWLTVKPGRFLFFVETSE